MTCVPNSRATGERRCDICPNRCNNPAVIEPASIDLENFYDLTTNGAFSAFQNQGYVQPYNGATVSFKKGGFMTVKYNNSSNGGPSPGFVILFKTKPMETYSIDVTAIINRGNQALIQAESLDPPGRLVTQEYKVTCTMTATNFEFQAASEFTVVGIFFLCETLDYEMRTCIFEVKTSKVACPTPIACTPWDECVCNPCNPCAPCNPYIPIPGKCGGGSGGSGSGGGYSGNCGGGCGGGNRHGGGEFPTGYCPPCANPVFSYQCNYTPCPPQKCCPQIQFINIPYKGVAVNVLEGTDCLSTEENFYVLETRNCKKGQCLLWECNPETQQLEIVTPLVNPFYFLDTVNHRIYRSYSPDGIGTPATCLQIFGCLGDKVWDLLTNTIWEYTKKGWIFVAQVNVEEESLESLKF